MSMTRQHDLTVTLCLDKTLPVSPTKTKGRSSCQTCPSGSASPPPCSATRRSCCLTSRSTAWAAALAAEGRTILLSSHLMSEMALTADRLLIIGRGRLIAQAACCWPPKALVLTAVTLATMTAACLGAYLAFQAFLPAGDPMHTTLATPGVLRAVAGAGLYLTVLALLGFGLGAVLRSSAGATAALLGALFNPTLLAALLPGPGRTPSRLPAHERRRRHLQLPPRSPRAVPLGRARRVLPVRRSRPGRRVRPRHPP